jgi:transcriptional regulator with GAF, ATPase, and Fis domain
MSTPDAPRHSGNKEDVLSQLSLELLRIRSAKQLFQLLNNRLKHLLGYSYSTIYLMNTNRVVLFNYFSELVPENQYNPFPRSIKATIVEDDSIFHQADSPKWKALKLNLYGAEELTGQWVLLYDEHEMVTEDCLENLSGIVDLIAATLINVLEYKKVQDRDMENDTIQSLNIDFAAIREKKDLLKIIHFKLKNLFDFSDQFVAVINDDELTLSSFLQDTRYWADEHPLYKRSVEAKYPLNDGIFNRVILSKEPHSFDLRQQDERGSMPEYFQILYDSGIRKVFMIGLHVRDRMIGLWCICQTEGQCMAADQLQLIKKISSQLSIAVENIKANEAIAAREEEGRLLLKLSEDIANIRDKNDLFNAINSNLKRLFGFEDIVIMVFNGDLTYQTFLISLSHQSAGYTYYQKAALKKHVNEDCCLQKVMRSEGMVVLNMKQLYEDETAPDYIRFEYENRIREKVAIKLKEDQKNIGVFFVNSTISGSYTDHELELIEGVSYQLSIAVSNILANEEIANREEEKTILLALSNEIASLKSRDDLFPVVNDRIKKIFSINQFGVVKISEDRLTHSIFMMDLGAAVINQSSFEEVNTLKYSNTDKIFSSIISSDDPVFFDIKQLAGEPGCVAYIKFWADAGFQQLLGLALRVGGDPIGIIFFSVDPYKIDLLKINLLKAVCAQLAVAISNILANEQIADRESERELLLSISTDLAAIRDHNELISIITRRLKHKLAFSHIFIGIVNDDQSTFSAFVTDPDSPSRAHPAYEQATKDRWPINDGIMDRVCASSMPVIFDLEELSDQPDIPLYLKINYESGLKQAIITRFLKGGKLFGIWAIFFNRKDALDKTLTSLIAGLANQISITVSNVMANEKVISQLDVIKRYKQQLEEEKIYLKEEIETTHNYSEIIGNGPEMQKVFDLVSKVAGSDSTVLILGETGTGKELIARAIHNNSTRKDRLMVKVNCATLPVNLIESELFGHERGSFTGATERRIGKFELANNGTLFLDEIGDLPLELQVKLLRALQEREVERIGGKGTIKVDVRVIAATNRDLDKETAEGRFRSDLYYRLNIFPICLPPLRSRIADIPLLAAHFIQRFSKKLGRQIHKISNSELQKLQYYNWPGNIRELEHLIERCILLTTGDTITNIPLPSPEKREINQISSQPLPKTIDENEREHILNVLRYCRGKITGEGGAAQRLGIPNSTLGSKMKRLGIKREDFR